MNIDRDSFNEHDEHFKALQLAFHDKLNEVFEEIAKLARDFSEKKRDKKEEGIKESLKVIISEQSKGKYKLIERNLKKNSQIVEVDKDKKLIILNTRKRPFKKKKANRIIRALMVAYHTAKTTSQTEEERDKTFYNILKEILNKLI